MEKYVLQSSLVTEEMQALEIHFPGFKRMKQQGVNHGLPAY